MRMHLEHITLRPAAERNFFAQLLLYLVNGADEGPAVTYSGIDVGVLPPHHVVLAQDADFDVEFSRDTNSNGESAMVFGRWDLHDTFRRACPTIWRSRMRAMEHGLCVRQPTSASNHR